MRIDSILDSRPDVGARSPRPSAADHNSIHDDSANDDVAYYDFADHLQERRDIKSVVVSGVGVRSKEAALSEAFEAWWKAHGPRLVRLTEVIDFMEVSAAFLPLCYE